MAQIASYPLYKKLARHLQQYPVRWSGWAVDEGCISTGCINQFFCKYLRQNCEYRNIIGSLKLRCNSHVKTPANGWYNTRPWVFVSTPGEVRLVS